MVFGPIIFTRNGSMRAFLIALFFTGVLLVVLNALVKTRELPERVEYRYLPRDLDTYLRDQPEASTYYKSMFTEEDIQLGR